MHTQNPGRSPRPRPRAEDPDQTDRPGAARAARLRSAQRREATRRDRPDRTLRHRRAARPPRRRRTARSELRQIPTPPPRPWRQPPTQLCSAPHRDHAGARLPASARLPRAQTERGKEPARSAPLPQTTTRTHRLHDTQKRAAIDIGATLAQVSAWLSAGDARSVGPRLRVEQFPRRSESFDTPDHARTPVTGAAVVDESVIPA